MSSGLFAQIGFAEEATYGTYVVPSRFLPFDSEEMKLTIGRMEFANSLGETRTVLRSDRWAASKRNVEGSIALKVLTRGFGMLFRHMLGGVAITTPGGGIVTRDHTHTLASLTGRMLTIQVGKPDAGGTVRPFSYLGCKITDWELKNAVNNFLELSLTIDGRDETTAQSLAAASYPTGNTPLTWVQGAVTVAGSAFPLREIVIKGMNGIESDRYALGEGLKVQPTQEEHVDITGEFTADFADLTAYDRYVNGQTAAIVATWQGPLIEGALFNQVVVTLPVCRFDGETPVVEGPERLTQKLTFKALTDGAQQPITILYRTTDTTS